MLYYLSMKWVKCVVTNHWQTLKEVTWFITDHDAHLWFISQLVNWSPITNRLCEKLQNWLLIMMHTYYLFTLLKYILFIMLLHLSQFSPIAPLCLVPHFLTAFPPYFMSMGRAYKLFASPFPVLFLTSPYFVPTITLFNDSTFSLILPFLQITLQMVSISMILFLFWLFA